MSATPPWLLVPGLPLEVQGRQVRLAGGEVLEVRRVGGQEIVMVGRIPHAVDELVRLAGAAEAKPALAGGPGGAVVPGSVLRLEDGQQAYQSSDGGVAWTAETAEPDPPTPTAPPRTKAPAKPKAAKPRKGG